MAKQIFFDSHETFTKMHSLGEYIMLSYKALENVEAFILQQE